MLVNQLGGSEPGLARRRGLCGTEELNAITYGTLAALQARRRHVCGLRDRGQLWNWARSLLPGKVGQKAPARFRVLTAREILQRFPLATTPSLFGISWATAFCSARLSVFVVPACSSFPSLTTSSLSRTVPIASLGTRLPSI